MTNTERPIEHIIAEHVHAVFMERHGRPPTEAEAREVWAGIMEWVDAC